MSADEIPLLMFEPLELFRVSTPKRLSISIMRFAVLVLPLVPVTPMILLGLATYLRKSGQILRATTPGKSVALWPVILRAGMESFAIISAIKNLNFIIC